MTEHTPGPWRVGASYGAVVTDVNHPGVWADDDNRAGYAGNMVCESIRSLANANLIAAAPDLLAACKAALGAFERNDCIDWSDLERAIAKAEGR